MKKLIVGVMLLGILGACGNKKTNIDPVSYTHLTLPTN